MSFDKSRTSSSKKPPHLFAAFGLPGVMAAWGFEAVRLLAKTLADPAVEIASDKLADFKEQYQSSSTHSIVITSHYPEGLLTDFILNERIPAILFTEDAGDAVNYLEKSGNSGIGAIRALTGSASCILPLFGRPNIIHISRRTIQETPLICILIRIAQHFRLTIDPAVFARTLLDSHSTPQHRLSGEISYFEDVAALAMPHYAPLSHASPGEKDQIVDGILAAGSQEDHALGSIIWPSSVFMPGDAPGTLGVGRIALSGGARCLVYGPYLHLPHGRWLARLIIDFDRNVRDQNFIVEVVAAGEVLARGRAENTIPGLAALSLRFYCEKPENPLEIRVFTENGAIEGSIALSRAELIPLASQEQSIASRFFNRLRSRALP